MMFFKNQELEIDKNELVELRDSEKNFLIVPSSIIFSNSPQLLITYLYLGVHKEMTSMCRFSYRNMVLWCNNQIINADKISLSSTNPYRKCVNELIDMGYLSFVHSKVISRKKDLEVKINYSMIEDEAYAKEKDKRFAMLFIDEIEDLLCYCKKNKSDIKSCTLLRVYAYFKMMIPVKTNINNVEIECFYEYYYNIEKALNICSNTLTKAINILRELNLISIRHIKTQRPDGSWEAKQTIFVNTYKREIVTDSNGIRLCYIYGGKKSYWLPEIKKMCEKLGHDFKFNTNCIKLTEDIEHTDDNDGDDSCFDFNEWLDDNVSFDSDFS